MANRGPRCPAGCYPWLALPVQSSGYHWGMAPPLTHRARTLMSRGRAEIKGHICPRYLATGPGRSAAGNESAVTKFPAVSPPPHPGVLVRVPRVCNSGNNALTIPLHHGPVCGSIVSQ